MLSTKGLVSRYDNKKGGGVAPRLEGGAQHARHGGLTQRPQREDQQAAVRIRACAHTAALPLKACAAHHLAPRNLQMTGYALRSKRMAGKQ